MADDQHSTARGHCRRHKRLVFRALALPQPGLLLRQRHHSRLISEKRGYISPPRRTKSSMIAGPVIGRRGENCVPRRTHPLWMNNKSEKSRRGLRVGEADAWRALTTPMPSALADRRAPDGADSADVADVVQETFLAAARSAGLRRRTRFAVAVVVGHRAPPCRLALPQGETP